MQLYDYLHKQVRAGVNVVLQQQPVQGTQDIPEPPIQTPPPKSHRINPRYVLKQSEIYDRIHNLTWSRCSVGQRWVEPQGCIGKVHQYTFDRAQQLANEVWRLPSREELSTLVDKTIKNQSNVLATDSVAFPDMDLNRLYYWTSNEEDNSFAWSVLFTDGGVPAIMYRNHRFALRLVHSGP